MFIVVSRVVYIELPLSRKLHGHSSLAQINRNIYKFTTLMMQLPLFLYYILLFYFYLLRIFSIYNCLFICEYNFFFFLGDTGIYGQVIQWQIAWIKLKRSQIFWGYVKDISWAWNSRLAQTSSSQALAEGKWGPKTMWSYFLFIYIYK